MKQKFLDELILLLENENKIYEEILKLSKQKTNIVVEGKVTELDQIVKLEQALVLQVSKIEKQRNELFLIYSSEIDFDKKNWNVSELLKIAEPEQKTKLKKYQESMAQILSELNKVNQLNSKLINNSLDFIEFSMNLFSTADLTSNNYGQKGGSLEKEKKNIFDIRL